MNTKPTYEELEARVKELEHKAQNCHYVHEKIRLESEERYYNVYNTAPLAFVTWDHEYTITDWNKQAEKIFGWSKEEVLHRNFFNFFTLHTPCAEGEESMKALFAGQLQRRSINEHFTKKGKSILCEWNNSILYDDAGQVRGGLSLALDITAQRQTQEELRKSSEKTKLFAYSIAHDLKNPALSIHGLVRRLQKKYRDSLDENAASYCDQIEKSAEQIATLVEMINQYISSKETDLCFEEVNPKEILQLIREEFSARLHIRQIDSQEPEDIPLIRADKLAFLRIFRNLIDNALKYGGETLRKIKIDYKNTYDYHIFSVYDDGIGLKKEESKGIFDLFKRRANSRGIEGTGLGLAIVKEIATRHHGDVWAEPGFKKGITFNVSISKFL